MPNVIDAQLVQPENDLLRRKREAAEEANRQTFAESLASFIPSVEWQNGNPYSFGVGLFTTEGMQAAFNDTPVPMAVRLGQRETVPADPSFVLDEPKLKKYMQNTDPDLITRFGNVESEDEANLVIEQNRDIMESRRKLAEMGWVGRTAMIGANLLEPTQLAVGLATGGIGTVASAGRGARLAAMARAGLAAGAPMAALEEFKLSQGGQGDQGDVLVAGLGGFGFGVGGSASRGLSRGARFATAGGGGALGAALVEVPRTVFDEDRHVSDLFYSVGSQFVLGGFVHSLAPTNAADSWAAVARRDLAAAGRRVQAKTQLGDIAAQAGGADVSAAMTDKGVSHFASALADTPGGRLARKLEELTGHPEPSPLPVADRAEVKLRLETPEAEQGAVELRRLTGAENDLGAILSKDKPAPAPTPDGANSLGELLGRADSGADPLRKLLTQDKPANPGFAVKTFDPAADIRARAAEVSTADRAAMVAEAYSPYVSLERMAEEGRAKVRIARDKVRQLTQAGEPVESALERVGRKLEAGEDPNSLGDLFFDELELYKAGATVQFMDRLGMAEATMHPDDVASIRKEIKAQLQNGQQRSPTAMGAASAEEFGRGPVAPEIEGKAATDFSLRNLTATRSAMAKILRWKISDKHQLDVGLTRFDMPGMVGQSPVPSMRRAANALGPDPLFKADGTPGVTTAPEWVNDTFGGHVANAENANVSTYWAYRKAQAAQGKKPVSRTEFMQQVTRAKRRLQRGATVSEFDAGILQVEKEAGARTTNLLDMAVRHDVPNSANFLPDPNYAPVIWDRTKLDAAIESFGLDRVLEAVAVAIRRDQPQLDSAQAVKVAKMVVSKAGNHGDASAFSRSNFLTESTRGEFIEAMKAANPDLSPEDMEKLLKIVKNEEPGGGEARFKRRTEMDHTYEHTYDDGKKLAIEDLLENDWEILERHYADHMIRSSAMTEVYRALTPPGPDATPATSVKGLLDKLEADAKSLGFKEHEYRNDLDKIEVMAKIAAGIPLSDSRAPHVRALRVLRNMQFFRVMSGEGSGIQNMSEFLPAIQQAGVGALMRQIPAVASVFSRGAKGELSNELLREIQTITGLGTERVIRRVMPRMADEAGALMAAGKAEMWSARAAQLAADASGQSAGQAFMTRATGALISQRWLDTAMSGKNLSVKRLAGLGLKQEMADRINGQMLKFATKEQGWAGHRLNALNLEKWTDIEAASSFRNALSRETRRLIMTNNQAAYAKWMTTEGGKVLAQLRTFAFGAWTNKLLYGVQQRDASNFIHMGVGMVAAGLTYTLRTYIDAAGRQDRAQFLQDRLSTSSIAKASFSRAAFSALIPTMADTVVHDIGGRAPIFSFARSSGLDGGAIFGNPTADWLIKAQRSIGAAQAPFFEDYDFSREDVNNIRGGLWVPRFMGLRQVIDQLGQRLPSKSLQPADE